MKGEHVNGEGGGAKPANSSPVHKIKGGWLCFSLFIHLSNIYEYIYVIYSLFLLQNITFALLALNLPPPQLTRSPILPSMPPLYGV